MLHHYSEEFLHGCIKALAQHCTYSLDYGTSIDFVFTRLINLLHCSASWPDILSELVVQDRAKSDIKIGQSFLYMVILHEVSVTASQYNIKRIVSPGLKYSGGILVPGDTFVNYLD